MKTPLLILGGIVLAAAVVGRRWIERVDERLAARWLRTA